jgi:hypothetical protein
VKRVKIQISWRKRYEILKVAYGEIGKTDKNGTAIGRYYSGNREWCAEFVSYCYYRANAPFDKGAFTSKIADGLEGGWMQRSSERIRDWFMGEGKYLERGLDTFYEYTPQAGDFALVGRAGSPSRLHAALIHYVSPNGSMYTIEGNNAGRPVAQYEYPMYRVNDTDNGTANGIILGIGVRDEIPVS